jgi:hypothetical protein
LPILKDGFKLADTIPPLEFRGAQQNNLIMLDANLELIRVPLRFPCGAEFRSGTEPEDAALKAARYWRHANLIADYGCSTRRD